MTTFTLAPQTGKPNEYRIRDGSFVYYGDLIVGDDNTFRCVPNRKMTIRGQKEVETWVANHPDEVAKLVEAVRLKVFPATAIPAKVEPAPRRSKSDEEAEKLAAVMPGYVEVYRSVTQYWADVDADDRGFERMMSNPHNDGANPPRVNQRVTDADLKRLERQYPEAYLYVRTQRQIAAASWATDKSADEAILAALAAGKKVKQALAAGQKVARAKEPSWD